MTTTASPPPRSNLIEVVNKLLDPYMFNGWTASEHTSPFNQRLDTYYGGEDALEKYARHIADNFVALEYIKSAGVVDFTAKQNNGDKPWDKQYPWTVHITAVDHDKFFALLEQEALQLVGDKIVEQLPVNLFPLPPIKQRIGSDFAIHSNGAISYKSRLIKLESAQANVAAAIMAASASGKYLTTNAIQETTGSVRVSKVISEIGIVFQTATQMSQHKFFTNDRMLGYKFTPK
jgi:hypothetical protein